MPTATNPHPIRPYKYLGQHFLHNACLIRRIVEAMRLKTTDHVVEIGPGPGALTEQLLPHVQQLDVIELDSRMIPVVTQRCMHLGHLVVHHTDALQFDFAALIAHSDRIRLCGNLPYNIATPLLFHLFRYRALIQDLHVMMQKEVADRLTAQPSENQYSPLSVIAQYHCRVNKLITVKPGAFQPPPKVDSAVIRLMPHHPLPWVDHDPRRLAVVIKQAFSQRRKQLRNSLAPLFNKQLDHLPIDLKLRPDQLTIADYINISNLL